MRPYSPKCSDNTSQIVQGGFSPADDAALSRAISQCRAIISLLGPNTGSMKDLTPTTYADIYSQRIFPLMRQHSVKRIFAMNTISVYQPEDKASLLRWLCAIMIWLVAGMAQKNMYAMQELFEDQERSKDIDWTMFRLGFIPGGHDESSWRKDREGEVYVGAVADQGWSLSQKRGQLAKWLVDAAIDGMPHLVHQMPAVSRLAGSRKNAD